MKQDIIGGDGSAHRGWSRWRDLADHEGETYAGPAAAIAELGEHAFGTVMWRKRPKDGDHGEECKDVDHHKRSLNSRPEVVPPDIDNVEE